MKKFFTGMIFIFLNFTLNLNGHVIGLLPAFIGYYFVVEGIKGFNGEVPAFEKIKQLCTVMIAVSAVFYILDLLAISLGFISVILGFAVLAANLYITFSLTEGILFLEQTRNINLNGAELRDKWKMFCIMLCAATVLILVPLINMIALIVNMVCVIMFLVAFNRTKNLGTYHGM